MSVGTSASRVNGLLFDSAASVAAGGGGTAAAGGGGRRGPHSSTPRLPTVADLFPAELAAANQQHQQLQPGTAGTASTAERRNAPFAERCDAFASVFHLLQQWHHHRRHAAGGRRGLLAAVDGDTGADAMLCFQDGLLGYASVFAAAAHMPAAAALAAAAQQQQAQQHARPERSWSIRLGARPASAALSAFAASSDKLRLAAGTGDCGGRSSGGERLDVKVFDATRLVLQVATDALFRAEDAHAALLALARLVGEEACLAAFRACGHASPLAWLQAADGDLPPACDSLWRVTVALLGGLPPCAFGFGEAMCALGRAGGGKGGGGWAQLIATAPSTSSSFLGEDCTCAPPPPAPARPRGGSSAAASGPPACNACPHRRHAARQAALALYTPAVLQVLALPLLRTPVEKAAALKDLMHAIAVCAGAEAAALAAAAAVAAADGEGAASEAAPAAAISSGGPIADATLSADDLLPRLCFVVAAAGAPVALASELAFVEEHLPPHLAGGSEGYCLVTLRSAVTHCIGLARAQLAAPPAAAGGGGGGGRRGSRA